MPFTIGPKIHNVVSRELKDLIMGFFSGNDWEGIYLTGGTCLAEYYFGHRVSQDMDLFTHQSAVFEEAARFLKANSFPRGSTSSVRSTPHLAQFLYHPKGKPEPIKIDLMLDIATHLSPPLKIDPVWVDSLEDLLANKMGCLVQRNDVKDYLDLLFLIPASYMSTREILALGQKKEAGLDPLIVAQQIEFVLAQSQPEPALLGKTDWQALKLFFMKFQKECLEVIRP